MADLKGLDSQEEEDPTIAEDVVVTKYKMAGDMANSEWFCNGVLIHIFPYKGAHSRLTQEICRLQFQFCISMNTCVQYMLACFHNL